MNGPVIFATLLGALFFPALARAVSTTLSCAAAAGTNWTSPNNIRGSDSLNTTYSTTAQNALNVTTCNFALPTGSTVQGFSVRLLGCGTDSTVAANRQVKVNILNVGTCTAKTLDQDDCAITTTDQVVGGTSDLWSCSAATVANVNSTAFGVSIADNDTTASGTLNEDYVEVTVSYAL